MYHYFYKITNLINNHFYYGIHSTSNLEDGYMGSGHRLHRAYKKYGFNNFIKEILKYFDTREEALDYELEIVNEELVKNNNCYNEILGGDGIKTVGLFPVKNIHTGEKILVSKEDERYLSGEYKTLSYGLIPAIDNNGNHFLVDKNDIRFKTKELKKQFEGKVCVIDNNGKKFFVDKTDKRYLSGELKPKNKNQILCVDLNGKYLMAYKDDKRLLLGEIKPINTGKKFSEEHKRKLSEAAKKRCSNQINTIWIYSEEEKINKKIKKEELDYYINLGFKKGRKIIFK